jgi:hypothetical protein
MRWTGIVVGVLALAHGSGTAGTDQGESISSGSRTEARQSFHLAVPFAPSAVRVGTETQLSYELHLTNFAPRVLTLERVLVADARTGRTLLVVSGDRLAAAIAHVGPAPESKLAAPPGGRLVAYLDGAIGAGVTPSAVRTLVRYAVEGTPPAAPGVLQAEEISVNAQSMPVLSPPLRGGPWVAVYDPRLERGHRRVFYAVGGRARLPGRFAVDWMPAGPQGGGSGESGLGAEVLAVADGVVASARDGVPEPADGAPRPRVSMADATGNYVSIRIGARQFAFYEHLLPGLRVKPGDRVKRGQVIGRLGSTGQASRPHLHFHLANADSPLGAEGLPYLLQGARTLGAYRSISAFEAREPWQAEASRAAGPAFPKPNVVVEFGSRP